jgi:class 3 adenylate cyclase
MSLSPQERAILFADVTGSTRIFEKLGDEEAARVIDGCLAILRACVEANAGRVVKTIGDEVMAVFAGADAAREAACEMQKRIHDCPPAARGVRLAIRVGFHFGPVLEDRDDFWGDAVNTASRLAELAKSGQVLTSGPTVEALPDAQRAEARDLQEMSVKGKLEAVRVFEIPWHDDAESTQLVGATLTLKPATRLALTFGTRSFDFPADKRELTLGRDLACDVVVQEKAASRRHARVERRGTQFYLVDESSNGTYVTIDGDDEVHLRRDQLMLRQRGRICFGVPAASASETLIYECE